MCLGEVVILRRKGNSQKHQKHQKTPAKQAYRKSLSHLLAHAIHRQKTFFSIDSRKVFINITSTADLH